MKSNRTLTVLGAGFLGARVAQEGAFVGWDTVAVKRSPSSEKLPFTLVNADLFQPESYAALPLSGYVVYALSPTGGDWDAYERVYDIGLRMALKAAEEQGCQKFLLTSSTSVYEVESGAIVRESDELRPSKAHPKLLLEAEGILQTSKIPHVTVRIGGLYGPGRTQFIDRVRQGLELPATGPVTYTNRIHGDDAARAIIFLLQRADAPDVVNLVDTMAAPRNDVIQFLRQELSLPPAAAAEATAPSMLRGNKRVSSELLQGLGFHFLFPTYTTGYRHILKQSMSAKDVSQVLRNL